MNRYQKWFIIITPIIGVLVLLSYVLGVGDNVDIMWGGVPEHYRGAYTISMLLSAFSYFVFTSYTFINILGGKMESNSVRKSRILLAYILILVPSALWVPLVRIMIDAPSSLIWFLIKLVLFLVAIGTFILLLQFLKVAKKARNIYYYISLVGVLIFLFHTGILDAIIWPLLWGK